MAHLTVDNVELPLIDVEGPNSDRVIVNSYKFVGICIKIADVLAALVRLIRGHLKALTLALCHVPHNYEVAVGLSSQ